MNVGRAITEAMREQRHRDTERIMWDLDYRYALQAWWWWGRAIIGRNHLGYPGADYPLRRR